VIKILTPVIILACILSAPISSAAETDQPTHPLAGEFSYISENLTRAAWLKLFHKNKIDEARIDFEQAVEARPDDIWAAYGLHVIYTVHGDYEKLLQNSINILKQRPLHPLSYLMLRSVSSLSETVRGYDEMVEPALKEICANSEELDFELDLLIYEILSEIYDRRRDRTNYDQAQKRLGYVRKWNTLGGYGKFDNINFFNLLDPEIDKSLKPFYEYEEGKPLRRKFISTDGRINPPWFEDGLCYAETFIRSPDNSRVVMRIKSAGSIKIFINGHQVYTKDAITKYAASTELVQVDIAKGWNRVLLKFIYDTDSSGVSFQIFRPEVLKIRADTKKHWYSSEKPAFKIVQPQLCEFFNGLVEENPDDAFAAGMLGIAHGFYGDNEQRKSLLYQAVEKNPRYAYFNYMLGVALKSDPSQPLKVATSKAKHFFEQALDLADTYPAALYRLSKFDQDDNKYPEAIEKLKLAVRQSPQCYLWRHALYNIYTVKSWERERKEMLDRIIELLPNSPVGYRVGWSYYQ